MIKRKRPIKDAPSDWLKKARTETQEAIAAYRVAARRYRKTKAARKSLKFAFNYQVYGADSLREALNSVYGYKCAYCETFFGASQPVAVEHYRPKGEVIEGGVRVKPGYYWLAATWANLLPSCTDCNSPRRQYGQSDGRKIVRGKGNHFPLRPGSKRARTPGKEKDEQPLLLHPELDDPEQHLEFATDLQRAGLILAKVRDGKQSEEGVESIEVYALDRPQLVQAREDIARRLHSHIRNTLNSERRHRAQPADGSLKDEYDQNLADLLAFIGHQNPYTAMSRQIVSERIPGVVV